MQPVNRLLRRAALWVHFRRLIEVLFVCLTIGATSVLGLRLAERFLGLSLDWRQTWIIAVSASAGVAILWVGVTWRRRLVVARLVDDAAGLKESLSTALCVERSSDPWSQAAVSHAARIAPGVPVVGSLPIEARRWWAAPLIIAGLFFAAGLLPQYDVLQLLQKAQAQEERQLEIKQAKQEVEAMEDRLDELMAKVDDAALAEPELETELPDPEVADPDAIRRAAVKKLTRMQDRLDALKQEANGGMLDALKGKLAELNTDKPSELDDLADALKSGNFSMAQKKLEELAKKLESGELSEEQKEALEKALENLAEQLEKLAQQRKALEDALKEAGLDPNLASDPEALKKALEQAQNLTPQQKQQLQQMADAANKACKACQGMAKAAAGAASKMAQGNAGAAMSGMGDQLSELEMLEQQLNELDAMAQGLQNEMNSMCQSMGQCNSSMLIRSKLAQQNKPGLKGGPPQSVEEADFNTNKIKVKSPNQDGPIIGSTLVEGEQVRGEAVRQFAEVVATSAAEAEDAIESKQIPRELHDAVKTYFGRLEKESGDAPADSASDAGN